LFSFSGWLSRRLGNFIIDDIFFSSLISNSGAQIIFRSFLQPVFSRYFSESGSTAANLRAQADSAGKAHAS
jgi:receptor expression-enhancing protein 5/6